MILNLTLVEADTYYPLNIPACSQWLLKARSAEAAVRFCESNDPDAAYVTYPAGFVRNWEGDQYPANTVYLRSPVAGTIIELEYY